MSHSIVIFGASGDLTRRKLIPALYRLSTQGRLPPETHVVGFSRTKFNSDAWRNNLAESTAEFLGPLFSSQSWTEFAPSIHYQVGDIDNPEDFLTLAEQLKTLEGSGGGTRVYYLATAPRFYGPAVAHLGQAGLADETHGPRRIVLEKPIGRNLKSAQALNRAVAAVFTEHQVFRIDHYLGKETVQNLLVLRFANTIFEPLWNRNYIDHVQITVAEEVTAGHRAGYYDAAGVMRDMFQNHLLQLMMVTAMEVPVRFDADLVRNEKVKVLEAVRHLDTAEVAQRTLRGQYDGYFSEPGVDRSSQTATFAAIHLSIDNWRWQGVPFYLRSGKAMSCRTTQIVVQFRQPPHSMFVTDRHASIDANRLVVQIQPAEGIQLHFQTKVPDHEMKLRMTELDFQFAREFSGQLPDAYQPLLLDALEGDASLFARSDEVEHSWKIIDPILQAWKETGEPALHIYEPGFWGPAESIDWMRRQGREWFDTCPVLGNPT
jgi:glucose-6-phosphate 1-dehydrogenase